MKAIKIIDQLDKLDNMKPQDFSRRQIFSKGLNYGMKAVMTAAPLALLLKPNSAKAIDNASIVGVLNFALTLEYLEAEFYAMGIDSGIVASADMAVIAQISKHETAHVKLLQDTITSLQGSPVSKPTFDFTAGGTYDPFNDYATFLVLANAFEDTGVRAYKGQAGNLLGMGAVLTAALDIHSVEARHASEIRRIRGQKGWITGNSTAGVPAAIYAGEDNVTQGGVDVTTITSVSASYITECFDEPLDKDAVLAIASPFIMS